MELLNRKARQAQKQDAQKRQNDWCEHKTAFMSRKGRVTGSIFLFLQDRP